MHHSSAVIAFLFTDIEGSTRLWEQEPERMPRALALHDALLRAAVENHHGVVVKMIGDGLHAAFDSPLDALAATLALQLAITAPGATNGVALNVRCGLHVGTSERRDNDFFGVDVNRAARIMSTAHGGQMLVSQALARIVGGHLPTGVTLRDLGSVRLRDLANAEHIYQIVHPQLRQDFPALRSLEAIPNNLPQQTSSFIGRERELADVKDRLRETRLMTLLGVGGLGKTRLALQVAADVMEHYPDGVWLMELAPVTDARLVPQVVASVLGVTEEAGRPVQEALVKHVKDRKLLLLFDNCEHLTHACADLAKTLLQSGPQLRILSTSREHLHVAGEATYPLSTLAAPDPEATLDLASIAQFEAVRLFIDRATAAQPGFRITAENARDVADICFRLDGIPLALELAAARVRTMSVDKIAARLTDRFRLLAGADRTVLPRQQTLRALIDWSYDLLTDPERTLLRRLAVFKGGFTLEAAERVGAGGELPEADVLDVLSRLVEKSLVVMDAQGERYFFLETVRQYAHERLAATQDGDAVRMRHLKFYLEFAEAARPQLVGATQGEWLVRLDLERENLLAAHAWCDHAPDATVLGLRLVHSIKFYWLNRGLLGLGYRVTLEALERPVGQQRDIDRCRALLAAGQLAYYMARYEDAPQYLERALAIARELGDESRVAAILQVVALASFGNGDLPRARLQLEESLALARKDGDKRQLAGVLNALAQLHRVEGALDTAEPMFEQVVAYAREVEDRETIATGLLNLAMVAIGRGANERAREMLLDVVKIATEIGSKAAGHGVLDVCAGLAARTCKWESAARFFGAAESQTRQTGLHRDPADEAFLAPLVGSARTSYGDNAFAAVQAAGGALGYDEAIAEARAWLAISPASPSDRV